MPEFKSEYSDAFLRLFDNDVDVDETDADPFEEIQNFMMDRAKGVKPEDLFDKEYAGRYAAWLEKNAGRTDEEIEEEHFGRPSGKKGGLTSAP